MSASVDSNLTPVPRWSALAGVLLLAAWLGWTVPALWLQERGNATATHDWNPAQLLAQIPPAVLAASADHPVLLRQPAHCPCAPASAAPHGVATRNSRLALPFDWLVLHDRRLVYAGPAVLGPGCGSTSLAATALVTQLLRGPQAPVILPTPCPCLKE
ncbi:TPA: hypothetical protein QDZ42_004215 [Stenotrophomonas maltophilia]|nr:hypothetical protein [Stenotrophomonas maltophilia]HDS1045524.1 hypothetical protein [Stenotrophomonas maltophilia]